MYKIYELEAHANCKLYVAKSFGGQSDFSALSKKLHVR